MAVKDVCTDFLKTTSVKGIGKAIRANTLFLKLTWIICILFGFSMTAYLLANIVIQYNQYETTTSIKELHGHPGPHFPDITICKLNPRVDNFNQSILDSFKERFEDVQKYVIATGKGTDLMNNHTVGTTTDYSNIDDSSGDDYDQISITQSDVDDNIVYNYDDYYNDDYNHYDDTYIGVKLADMEYANVAYELLKKMEGQKAFFQYVTLEQIKASMYSSFLLMCQYDTWKGMYFTCKDIKPHFTFVSPDYPQCLTFKIPPSLRTHIKSFFTILYLHDFEKSEHWSEILKHGAKEHVSIEGIDTSADPVAAKGVKVIYSLLIYTVISW